MKKTILAALLASILLTGAQAHDKPSTSLERVPLATAKLKTPQLVAEVPSVRINFKPGQPTGRHVHPIPVLGYVQQGAFIVKIAGEPPRRYAQGETVYEPADTVIERFDNASRSRPAVLVAFYLAGAGQRELIRMVPPEKRTGGR